MSRIDRRTFLKGVGVAVALPALESLAPFAAAQAKAAPVRTAFLFVPNGVDMAGWTPAAEGALGLSPILAPLKEVQGSLNVVSGLAQMHAFANGDGPGDHARSCATWLTGVQARKTSGADISVAVSADQIAAQAVGRSTKFASLELGCERGALAGDCDSGYSCAYSSSVSWRGPSTPNAKEVNPRAVFERLFGEGPEGGSAVSSAERQATRRSVLDYVLEEAESLKSRLGTRDKSKLDEYLEGVREIEMRLERFEKANANAQGQGFKVPGSAPSDRGEHVRIMGDMMVLAFQADLTRVCTLMFANEGSNRPYREIGINDGHHDISHHGNDAAKLEKKRQIDTFHVEQLAYILKRMQSVKEGSSSLLDNTVLVYGGGISDGNRHNHDDLPILVAGKAGGRLKTGRHLVVKPQTPMTNLLLNVLDYAGVNVERLGDSTGKLQGVF
ncbi:MAG: DUF1552 domain-containing protein [Armatimonadetes bacterium]|nr:DUF1552 domain-containing protein [Armatimonadota bacterium]